MTDAEDRLWSRLWAELDAIKAKLDTKVSYIPFDEFKRETGSELKELREDIDQLKNAAITPDQITSLIGEKLQESQARGITARDRWIRWIVAGATLLTSALLIYDRLRP
jgi:hypothetical protein